MFCGPFGHNAPPIDLPSRLLYRMHTSRFEVRPVRPLARPCRAPPRFVTLAKAGVHPWLRMPPQPVESRANRLRLPRKPRLGPGSEAGATDGGMQYKANGNRCVNPVARLLERRFRVSVPILHFRSSIAFRSIPFRSSRRRLPRAAGPCFARIACPRLGRRGRGQVRAFCAGARFARLIAPARAQARTQGARLPSVSRVFFRAGAKQETKRPRDAACFFLSHISTDFQEASLFWELFHNYRTNIHRRHRPASWTQAHSLPSAAMQV